MDEFTCAYIEAALWSSNDDKEIPLDQNYSIDDLAPETLGQMIADCAKFQLEYSAALKTAYAPRYAEDSTGKEYRKDDYTVSSAGHDFWLTRCGHGAGFWDRGLDDVGETLSTAARAFGNIDLYVGADGKIYA